MDGPPPVSGRALALGTLAALAVAVVVLVFAILPAQYGVDPTGFGAWAGLTSLAAPGATVDAPDPDPAPQPEPTDSATVYTYVGTFPTSTAPGPGAEGTTAEGETTAVTLPVGAANVTRVTATLAWTDDDETPLGPTEPDLFELRVRGPDGRLGDAVLGRNREPGGPGNVTATLAWRAPPAPIEADAEDPAAARASLTAEAPADASGTGDWTFLVTLVEAGDAEANGLPVGADDGNAWTLTVTVETYSLDVASKPGSGVKRDRLTLPVAAGEDFEYKLRLQGGSEVAYTWSTEGGPLYFDFHGEREGDTSGGFTRHDAGSSTLEEGTLTAPFTGSHGWYWRNDGDQPVTITLRLEGRYDIIGRV